MFGKKNDVSPRPRSAEDHDEAVELDDDELEGVAGGWSGDDGSGEPDPDPAGTGSGSGSGGTGG